MESISAFEDLNDYSSDDDDEGSTNIYDSKEEKSPKPESNSAPPFENDPEDDGLVYGSAKKRSLTISQRIQALYMWDQGINREFIKNNQKLI
jgi:hypothetical protein